MNKPYIISESDGWLRVGGTGDFSVFRTFDCGQCFRFDPVADPSHKTEVGGVANGRYVRFAEDEPGEIFVMSSRTDFEKIWLRYLSLDADYDEINSHIITALDGDDRRYMEKAAEVSRGIRILRQDRWETLCSFIVSQNNNIPRIKKIIAEMSEKYGEKIPGGFAFPSAERLCNAGEKEIFALHTGFRAKYIYDAARRVFLGETELDEVSRAACYADAEKMLLEICGVGPKVAACTLLFGFGRLEAFPIDVWIKRVIATRFPNGLDPTAFGPYAGIAQQYLFYCERYVESQPKFSQG